MTRHLPARFAILATLAIFALALLAQVGAQKAASQAELLLGKALNLEDVAGNLKDAIATYEQVLKAPDATRAQQARAQFRIGACYERLGLAGARKAYELVVSQYGDQSEFASQARTRLAALGRGTTPSSAAGGPRTRSLWKNQTWGKAQISPDGTKVAFSDDPSDLWIRDIATGADRNLTRKPAEGGGTLDFIWSPDSSRLTYDWSGKDASGGFRELRIVDVRTGAVTSVPRTRNAGPKETVPYRIGTPMAWSPDGRRLLVAIAADHLVNVGRGMGWLSLDDGSLAELKSIRGTMYGQAAVSPDGAFIAYGMSGRVHVAASDGSTNVPLVSGSAVAWTPDGSGLLYRGTWSGITGLWLLPMASGQQAGPPTQVSVVGENRVDGLTRSGALLYAVAADECNLWLATADLSAGRILDKRTVDVPPATLLTDMPSFSPDGLLLAYRVIVSDRRGLVFAASDGTKPRLVLPALGRGWGPYSWSSDSKALFVISMPEPGMQALMRVDVQTAAREPVIESFKTGMPGEATSFLNAVSSDGRTAFYIKSDPGTGRASLWSRDVATGQERLLNDKGYPLCLSPDGRHLAVSLWSGDRTNLRRSQLVILPLDGGPARTVCELPEGAGSAVWSPDGRYIVFTQGGLTSKEEALVIDANGGQPKPLGVSASHIRGVAIHPDGKHLTYATLDRPDTEWWLLENFLPKAKAEATRK